jgi:hypothetical protein
VPSAHDRDDKFVAHRALAQMRIDPIKPCASESVRTDSLDSCRIPPRAPLLWARRSNFFHSLINALRSDVYARRLSIAGVAVSSKSASRARNLKYKKALWSRYFLRVVIFRRATCSVVALCIAIDDRARVH